MRFFSTLILIALCIGSYFDSEAQPWASNFKTNNPTLPEIQEAFYDYWKGKPIAKGQGYKQCKRWEWYWESRVEADGTFPSSAVTWNAWKDYVEANPESDNKSGVPANWSFQGPSTTPGGYNGFYNMQTATQGNDSLCVSCGCILFEA